MPAVYLALADVETAEIQADTIPRSSSEWLRDLRAKALTDVDERSGIIAAQRSAGLAAPL